MEFTNGKNLFEQITIRIRRVFAAEKLNQNEKQNISFNPLMAPGPYGTKQRWKGAEFSVQTETPCPKQTTGNFPIKNRKPTTPEGVEIRSRHMM